ncbi:zf-HC2 domain-containing protein [candidate division KSB1 bacterium]|nr:zf-HC2 domain-containing protein [candidate division KSB1 bacterium]
MKSCQFEHLLLPYLQGELAKDDRLRLSSHLATCQNCRAVLADLKSVDSAMQHYRRAEAPRDLYASYVRQLETRFKPESPLKSAWRWLQLAAQPILSPSPSWRLARAAAILLVGVLLGRTLFHPSQMATINPPAPQVMLTRDDVQFIADYVVQSELLLLTIANSATDDPTDDDIYMNKDIARNLLFKTAQVQRKAVALQDDVIITFFNHLELVLLEISNRDDDEIRTTFRDIKNMILESDMVQKSRRLQHRLETTLAKSA